MEQGKEKKLLSVFIHQQFSTQNHLVVYKVGLFNGGASNWNGKMGWGRRRRRKSWRDAVQCWTESFIYIYIFISRRFLYPVTLHTRHY